jgi:hypothetical protein
VPVDLERVIAKAIEKERKLRYQTAARRRAFASEVARPADRNLRPSAQEAGVERLFNPTAEGRRLRIFTSAR